MTETLVEQARRLSSGTMATLTGARDYATLDIYRDEFARFCSSQPQSWTWMQAWRAYTGKCITCGKVAMYRLNGYCEECIPVYELAA